LPIFAATLFPYIFEKTRQSDMNTEPQATIANDEDHTTVATETTAPEVESQEAVEVSETDKLYIEVAELKDKYLRLYADFENFRRRTAKEKLDIISTANEDLMKAVLPVLDDFERAMGSFETVTEIEPLKEGVGLIYHKFSKTLEQKGLKPMLSKGENFDADLHESIAQFPAPSEDLKNKVIDEVEKGYLLNEKVIRYAKVVVGS
jgi:molecular chaperone GrpE